MKKQYLLIAACMISALSFSQSRVTMLETFTSSTCAPCNPGNINLEGLLANPQNDNKQVSMKYQMSWPGNGDPYYTSEGEVRRDVYGIGGIPATRIDGNTEINTGSLTQNNLNAAYAVAPKALITAYYTVDEPAKTIDVTIDVEVLVNTPPGVRVYVGVFEYVTSNNAESNGETSFFHVMKKMLPDASGTVMPPLMAGSHYYWNESYTFNGNYRLPNNSLDPIDNVTEHSVEQFSDLGVAVWLQQLSTREVYQAGYGEMSSTGLDEGDIISSSVKIYPNPASNNAVVSIQLEESQDVNIEIYDGMGKVVYADLIENVETGRTVLPLETSNLINGLYTVRLSTANSSISKRLSIQK